MSHLDYGNSLIIDGPDLSFASFNLFPSKVPVTQLKSISDRVPSVLKTPQDFLIKLKSKSHILSKAWKALCNYSLISSPISIPTTLLLAHPTPVTLTLCCSSKHATYIPISAPLESSSPNTFCGLLLCFNHMVSFLVTRYQAHPALPSPTHTSYFSCYLFL